MKRHIKQSLQSSLPTDTETNNMYFRNLDTTHVKKNKIQCILFSALGCNTGIFSKKIPEPTNLPSDHNLN